jgi:Resolvase, N terminal domain
LHLGDVPLVTRIDRLARSIGELQGAVLKATERPIDTSTAAGKCFLDMLGVFAEFETNLRRERQLEGIAKAKAAGVYNGRPGFYRGLTGAGIEGSGHAAHRHPQGTQNWPGGGLSGAGNECVSDGRGGTKPCATHGGGPLA